MIEAVACRLLITTGAVMIGVQSVTDDTATGRFLCGFVRAATPIFAIISIVERN